MLFNEKLEFIEAEAERQGKKRGEEKLAALMRKLFSTNRIEDAVRAASDPEFRKELYQEFDICR